MKRNKLFCVILVLILACTVFPVSVSADTPEERSFADGTVIVNSDLLEGADDLTQWFEASVGTVTPTWNAETGRVRLTSGSGNTIVNLTHFPIGMDEYTISADLYVISGDSSLAGMGIHAAGVWSRSFYLQLNAPNSRVYLNNFGTDGAQKTGKAGWVSLAGTYTVGTSKVNCKFVVKNDTVTTYFDDTLIGTENLALSNIQYDPNVPFFLMRGNSVLEIGNLSVYDSGSSGTVSPDASQIGLTDDEVTMIGYQKSDAYLKESVSSYDIRLIAEVDALTYETVGLEILATVDETTYRIPGAETTKVYTSVSARDGDGSLTEITPSAEGKYLVAIVITGIPADTLPTFSITPYLKQEGSSETYQTYVTSFTVA